MAEWFLYSTIFPLSSVPLVLIATKLMGSPKHLFHVIRDGQLYFYCTTLIALLLKEIVNLPSVNGLVFGFLVLAMLACTFVYGVAVAADSTQPKDDRMIAWTSIGAVATVVAIVGTIRVSEGLI